MNTNNPTGWKADVALSLGPKFKPWFQFATVTEGSSEVTIGLGGPWELAWFRNNFLEIVRKAVRAEIPGSIVTLYLDADVRQQRIEWLASKASRKSSAWNNDERFE